MAPATPAKGSRIATATPATARTTRSKVAIPLTLAEHSQPSPPSVARGSKIPNRPPMTTGKVGLLGKKPSRLFADKDGGNEVGLTDPLKQGYMTLTAVHGSAIKRIEFIQ